MRTTTWTALGILHVVVDFDAYDGPAWVEVHPNKWVPVAPVSSSCGNGGRCCVARQLPLFANKINSIHGEQGQTHNKDHEYPLQGVRITKEARRTPHTLHPTPAIPSAASFQPPVGVS